MGEIAAAGEQSNGIAQLNAAMNEMDIVVHRTAANAVESAAAAEELSAMTAQMEDHMDDLLALVSGREEGGRVAAIRNPAPENSHPSRRRPTPCQTAAITGSQPESSPPRAACRRGHYLLPNPSEVILFDESEFKDF